MNIIVLFRTFNIVVMIIAECSIVVNKSQPINYIRNIKSRFDKQKLLQFRKLDH